MNRTILYAAILLAFPSSLAVAQQGYEFEVYDTELAKSGTMEFELNVNFVASGLSPRFELAVSVGRGLTKSSDRTVIATRVEYLIGR
jgi:hypothetical protein